ncbi:MAG TPA: HEAT repeat domain-containing protein [Nitrolancea sp.]|jgi:HEAT repeat protein|nr:HEAT repeat domain-containing protein [Nitrolancea sp.]
MFFTTNRPNPESENTDVIRVLNEFIAGERNAVAVRLLSDLDRPSVRPAKDLWLQIPTDVRLFVTRQMLDQAETNVQLDFSRMFTIALDDPDDEVRTLAIQGLWEDESTAQLDRFLSMLEFEAEPTVRAAIVEALGAFTYRAALEELDEGPAQRLRSVLLDIFAADEPVAVRKRALESVAYFQNDLDVEDAIDEAYESDYQDLRIGAIFAMGRNLSARWFDLLLNEMQDEDPEVRFEATRAIGLFGDERAVSLLLDLLDDEDREVQLAAIGSLGEIGGTVAIGTLRRIVRSDDSVVSDAAGEALTQATISTDPLRLDR